MPPDADAPPEDEAGKNSEKKAMPSVAGGALAQEGKKRFPQAGMGTPEHNKGNKGSRQKTRDRTKGAAAPNSDVYGRQFDDAGSFPGREPYALTKLSTWHDDGCELPSDLPPPTSEPGIYFLCSPDIRSIAAYLRADATPEDVVLDIDQIVQSNERAKKDGSSLLELLETHLPAIAAPGRLAIHRGTQAGGLEFWESAAERLTKIDELCKTYGSAAFVAVLDADASLSLTYSAARLQNIDPWPLVQELAVYCPSVTLGLIEEARQLVDRKLLMIGRVIEALDGRDALNTPTLGEILAEAKDKEPSVVQAREFIDSKIAQGEPSNIAVAFTAACFDALSTNEFRKIAQDLVETPDLVEPSPPLAKPDEPVVKPRTRIDEKTLREVGIVLQPPYASRTKAPVMALRAKFNRAELRKLLAAEVPFTAAKFVDQMAARLVHGAVSPERWQPCCDVIGQVLLNEVGGSPELLGTRIAQFWFAERKGMPDPDRDRTESLVAHSEEQLEQLCTRVASLAGGFSSRTLQIDTAKALAALAKASSVGVAWQVPVAAGFVTRLLRSRDGQPEIESLLRSCMNGSGELITLLSAGLSGEFGMAARGADAAHLDALLATFIGLSREEDNRPRDLQMFSRAVSLRLSSIRLAFDAERLATPQPQTIAAVLSRDLLKFVVDEWLAKEDAFEFAAPDAMWMDTERFEFLGDGWRPPPPHFLDPFTERMQLAGAEAAYFTTMRAFDAITASRSLGPERKKAIADFLVRIGLPPEISLEAVALWIPDTSRQQDAPPIFSTFPIMKQPSSQESLMRAGPDDEEDEKVGEGWQDGEGDDDTSRAIAAFAHAMRHLRRAVPLLAVAFSQARSVETGGERKIVIDLPNSFSELVRDRGTWSALREAADKVRNVLEPTVDLWRDATQGLPRSDAVRAARVQSSLHRSVFREWWSAVVEMRAAQN